MSRRTAVPSLVAMIKQGLDVSSTEALRVAARMVPVVVVADLIAPENTDSSTSRMAAGGTTRGAVAGQYSHVQLFNPVGSGNLVVLTYVSFSLGGADQALFGLYNTVLTNISTNKGWRDGRLKGSPASLVAHDTNVALLGSTIFRSETATAADSVETPFEVVLDEGQGFVVKVITVNVALTASFVFDEVAK